MRRDDHSDGKKPGAWRRLRVAIGSTLGGWIIRLLGMTWRIRRVGAASFDAMLSRNESFIPVFWHGEILPITWVHRGKGFAPLISRHSDGEVIARIVEDLGYRTVRGSTTRGGVRALLESAQLVNEGVCVAMTPDGPRGPRHEFAPGALIVAQRTGRPIVALAATASRAWFMRSWDRHIVPKPFATVTITYSEPQFVLTDSARDASQEQPRFQALLGALAERP
jgi:lysophospholipid acyltransferase (LPLAT)-like uncharacterized protein